VRRSEARLEHVSEGPETGCEVVLGQRRVAEQDALARRAPVVVVPVGREQLDRPLGGEARELPAPGPSGGELQELTEALTDLPRAGVPDEVYAEAVRHFDDAELGNLIGAIAAINAWNQVGVGTALRPSAEVAQAVA
jgi:hypothetical protein